MNCPQCQAPMDCVKQPGFLSRVAKGVVTAVLTGSPDFATDPNYRCSKCSTEVRSPIGENFVLYIETLEDYRKSCELQATQYRSLLEGRLMSRMFDPAAREGLQTQLVRVETSLRVLAATTLEERLRPELIGPAERDRIAIESGAPLAEVDELLTQFAHVRDFYRDHRAGKLPVPRFATPWWFRLQAIVPTAVAVGAGVWGAFDPVAASVLSFLGYSLVCAFVFLVVLELALRGFAFHVCSSWWRFGLFAVLIPMVPGACVHVFAHDRIVQAGLGLVPLWFGCLGLWVVLIAGASWLVTSLYARIIQRDMQREIQTQTARLLAERASSSSPVS